MIQPLTHIGDESYKDDHANTGDDVCMILDDKFMTEHWRAIFIMWPP